MSKLFVSGGQKRQIVSFHVSLQLSLQLGARVGGGATWRVQMESFSLLLRELRASRGRPEWVQIV